MITLAQPEAHDAGIDARRVVDVHPIEIRRLLRKPIPQSRSWIVTVRRADGTVNEGRIFAQSVRDAQRKMIRSEREKLMRVTRIVRVVPC